MPVRTSDCAPLPRTNATNLIKTQLAGCAPTSTFVNRPGAVKAATTACFGLYAGGQRSRTFGDAHGRVLRRNCTHVQGIVGAEG